MKQTLQMILLIVIIMTVIIASAGAIGNGFLTGHHFYTVFGILNLIGGGYAIYRYMTATGMVRTNSNKKK